MQPSGGGDVLLELDSLRKSYGGGRRPTTVAVNDVSFVLRRGQTMGIVGESGSGKTTIARLATGIENPDSGSVTVDGTDIGTFTQKSLARTVQMVFQDPLSSLDRRQRVGDALDEVQRRLFSRSASERRARSIGLLEAVGLPAKSVRSLPRSLSGGQRQRVSIALALVAEPKLVILDEAVSALDVSIQAQVLNLLVDLRSTLNLTYLFISHDLGVIGQLCDEVAVIYRGQIVELGHASDLLRTPSHPYTRLLVTSIPDPAKPIPPRAGSELKLHSTPTGCQFSPRCPEVHEPCLIEPTLEPFEGREIRCWLYNGTRQESSH